MLGTLVEKLQGLFSKYFVVAAFFPVLIFAALNTVAVCFVSKDVRGTLAGFFNLSPAVQGFYGFGALIVIALIAYVYSTTILFLRELLGGRHWPQWLVKPFVKIQTDRFAKLQRKLAGARQERRNLRRSLPKWQEKLRSAREAGNTLQDCKYTETPAMLRDLENLAGSGQQIPVKDLAQAVDSLEAMLRQCNANLANSENALRLDRDHRTLLILISDAMTRAELLYTDLSSRVEFNYSQNNLQPTQMGNIAQSVNYYAQSRYGLNLDFFWTRLQRAAQNDEKFFNVLLDAKAQLDFLVGLFWISLLTFCIWLFIGPFLLPIVWPSVLCLVLLWVAAPLILTLWYQVALQNFRAFADLLRATIDLYRLELLKLLHIPLPPDSQSERVVWDTLNRQKSYGEVESGIAYKHG
jgi:hypothetical protein